MAKSRQITDKAIQNLDRGEESNEPATPTNSGFDYLDGRSEAMRRAEQTVRAVQRRVHPNECRVWSGNARDYSALTYESVAPLIHQLISRGKQEIPAIVRKINEGAEEAAYEIIAGSRRHWAIRWLIENGYPDFRYFIEVRHFHDDEEAFHVSDVENRDREDLSPYERAVNFRAALANYFGGKQHRMAKRMEMSESSLSRLLSLADLPDEAVDAFPDHRELSVKLGTKIHSLLRDGKKRERLLRRAQELKQEMTLCRVNGSEVRSAPETYRELERATLDKRYDTKGFIDEFKSDDGRLIARLSGTVRSGYGLRFSRRTDVAESEFMAAMREVYHRIFGRE